MATLVVKTIGSGGGHDYSTIAAFIAAAQARDVVANDEIWRGELADEVFAESPSFSGLTGDATRYVELTTQAGASWKGAARTGGLRYNTGNGAAIAGAVSVLSPRVRLTGLQFRQTGWANTVLYINSGATSLTISDCIFEGYLSQYMGYFDTASGTHKFSNLLFIQDSPIAGNGLMFRNAGTYNLSQISVVRPSNQTPAGTAFWADWASLNVKNCAGFGYSVFNNGWASGSNNGSDVSIGFGSSNQASLAYADQFEETSAGGGVHDFRLKTGAALIGAGTDLSGDGIVTDITGFTRAPTPSIGAYEAGVAALIRRPWIFPNA